MKLKNLLLFFLFFLSSCGSRKNDVITIPIDPYFFPKNFGEREGAVNAYVEELLLLIAIEEDLTINLVRANWDAIWDDLELGKYNAIIATDYPNAQEREKYSFSDPLLLTGPVLVLEEDSKKDSLEDLSGMTLVMVAGYSGIDQLQKYPNIIVRNTTSIADALNQVADKEANGALIPAIFAKNYVDNLYSTTLKIVGDPLTDEGLFLTTMQGSRLTDQFNAGFERLVKEGKIKALKDKWGL